MENTPLIAANILTGADTLGFCINLATATDHTDSSQRVILLDVSKRHETTKYGITYLVPDNVSVNDLLDSGIEYSTFASRSEFSDHMSAQTSADVSGWGFTGEFKAAYSKLSKGQASSIYGLVEAHSTLWEAKIQQLETTRLAPEFALALTALPAVFTSDTQAAFFDFFNKYGTHIITGALAGGYLHYYVSVTGSSSFTEESARAQLKLEYDSVFVEAEATGKTTWKKLNKSWLSSRTSRLAAVGGQPDELLSKAAPPTDIDKPVNYQGLVGTWAKGVSQAPGIIGVKLQLLSKLVPVSHVHATNQALQAYLNAEVAADCLVRYTYSATGYPMIDGAGYSVMLGQSEVTMPHPPAVVYKGGNFWIVLADSRGQVHFNQNVLADDSRQFDQLVHEAQQNSAKREGTEWVAVVASTPKVGAPSPQSIKWLDNCGITTRAWREDVAYYPGAPFQFTAVGKTNSPKFAGSTAALDMKSLLWQVRPRNVDLNAEVPLFISASKLQSAAPDDSEV